MRVKTAFDNCPPEKLGAIEEGIRKTPCDVCGAPCGWAGMWRISADFTTIKSFCGACAEAEREEK